MTENLHDAIARAIGDPGSILERREDETVTRWSARAVAEILAVVYGVDREGHFPNTRASLALMKYAELRGELKRANALLSDAWGIIANAENFKHTLVCEHGHRCQDREGHTIDELTPEPIGPQVWRDAAVAWRDRWHAFMDVKLNAAPVVPASSGPGHCGLCGFENCPGKPGEGCTPGPWETYKAAGDLDAHLAEQMTDPAFAAAYRARQAAGAGDGGQDATCGTCGGGIWYQDCPTGGWWIHDQHPVDGHDAEPFPADDGEPFPDQAEDYEPRCGNPECAGYHCGSCGDHTGQMGHYAAFCQVTRQRAPHHFCCPDDCELHPAAPAAAAPDADDHEIAGGER